MALPLIAHFVRSCVCVHAFDADCKFNCTPRRVLFVGVLSRFFHYAGASGRGVGKVLGMSKANVYNWIKKNGSGSR
ncbi:MAG: hypothetical protein LBR76_01670 [Oscillospiraceae bacterium]|nr:hypothetical protein [Oscillospiraceae bacterium]